MATDEVVVIFRANSSNFATETEKLVEIIHMVEIQALPNSPKFLKGVVNYRGDMMPVCDLNVLLGGKEQKYGLTTPILIVKEEPGLVGFIVDEVAEILSLDRQVIKQVSHTTKDYVVEAFDYNGEVHLVIDLTKVLKAGDKALLKKSSKGALNEKQFIK